METGYELRNTEGRGEGIFATRPFKKGETVMVGLINEILHKNTAHAAQIGEHTYAMHEGLICKVNHSCDPNCGIFVNRAGGHDFVAFQDIEIDDEITFDYAMRNYSVDHFPARCLCGATQCRGYVTGWKDLPAERKKQYAGFIAPYLLDLDARVNVYTSSTQQTETDPNREAVFA